MKRLLLTITTFFAYSIYGMNPTNLEAIPLIDCKSDLSLQNEVESYLDKIPDALPDFDNVFKQATNGKNLEERYLLGSTFLLNGLRLAQNKNSALRKRIRELRFTLQSTKEMIIKQAEIVKPSYQSHENTAVANLQQKIKMITFLYEENKKLDCAYRATPFFRRPLSESPKILLTGAFGLGTLIGVSTALITQQPQNIKKLTLLGAGVGLGCGGCIALT